MTIDWWTLALQTINVVVLVALLGRFFFRPVAAAVAARKAEIAARLADADAARAEADRLMATRQAELDAVDAERDRLIAAARAEAERQGAALTGAAREEALRITAQGAADVARARTAAEDHARAEAERLALAIARRLVARLPAASLNAAFADGLAAELGALTPGEQAQVAEGPVRVTTAAPLAEADRAALAAALAPLGAAAFETAVDPGLVAGLTLTAPGLLVENAWGADLGRIAKEFRREHT
ncbi:F0F1 ATP synthase subunit B family protein [Acuticoccus yangtzensis]|uniref:F0F1 ATP synthase subunit B family protein n=1 Tax=Acuticoccus yangtzensis TaxID=1443441 RepID=UPI0009496FC6|nr:ATP synthase F0 subunit B [Acuticoccus yangtzensis]